jgi:ubiquitin carboxyl-terminal hydrolase 5/13
MNSGDLCDLVQKHAASVKVAQHNDRVYDECMFCFRTPLSEGGLFNNLRTFQGFCRQHVLLDHERSGNVLYLHSKQIKVGCLWLKDFSVYSTSHLKYTKNGFCSWFLLKRLQVPIPEDEQSSEPEKLAIGVPGGFNIDGPKHRIEEEFGLAVMPSGSIIPLNSGDIPPNVMDSIISVQVGFSLLLLGV